MYHYFFSSRRRHTRWNCDWSSDVCSSDLNQNETRTPSAKTKPERSAFLRSPPCSIRESTLIDKTGKTQGIRFKISPPMKANRHASHNDTSGKAASVGPREGRGAASCATLSTATSKARLLPWASRTTRIPDKEPTLPF